MTLENNEFIVSIPQRGFVAGDEVPINVQIRNPDDDASIVCALYRQNSYRFSYTIVDRNKSSKQKICERTKTFPRGQRDCNILLKIPEDKGPPSTIDPTMKTINVQYRIVVVVRYF